MTSHACVECQQDPPATIRKIANPGDGAPRCTTHLRRFKTRQRQQARGRHVERTYDISAADAGDLLVFQGGRCWICDKATGASKLLAVDHDHGDDWVRGRLCSTCNQFIGRQLGDDPAKVQRLLNYLSGDTPYRRMLATRMVSTSPDRKVRDLYLVCEGPQVFIYYRYDGQVEWMTQTTTLDLLQRFAVPRT